MLGPLLLLIALAVRRSLGSPVLLHQVRVGRHGRPFGLLMFRSTSDAGAPGSGTPPEAVFTRLGKWLRSTMLDGLPALINVLRGEMSLVGPRPLLPEDLPHCSAKQARRHDVRPGMTGWAAVQGGDAASWERCLALDVWYVDHWSLGLDLKILLMAVAKVVTHQERPRGASTVGPAAMPRLDERAPPENGSQAVQSQTLLLAPEAAGWRIKRVHERAKSVG